MRTTVAVVPALLVTLGLLYLMQYMVTGPSPPARRFGEYAAVDFVRLHRATEQPRALGALHRSPPEPPGAVAPSPSPELASVEPATPAAPDLSPEVPRLEPPSLSATPYLGSPPVKARKPVPADKPSSAAKKSAKPAPARNAVERGPEKTALASLPKTPSPGRPGGMGGSGGQVHGEGGADSHLVPLFKIAPRYPRKAAMSGQEGWVKVAFTITAKGTVTDAVVVESKPRRLFNRSALTAIRKWRFKPQVVDGKPVPVRATQVIEFKLASK